MDHCLYDSNSVPGDGKQALFPGRLEIVFGDSKETVPAYTRREEWAGRNPRACNILFVDGDHNEHGAYADIFAFEALANRLGDSSTQYPETVYIHTVHDRSPYCNVAIRHKSHKGHSKPCVWIGSWAKTISQHSAIAFCQYAE